VLLLGPEDLDQQPARDGEQPGDLGRGEPVEHLTPPALGQNEVVASEDCQVLGQVRGLQTGLGQQLAHRHVVGAGLSQHLQDPDAQRMGQALEQPGLDLVQGPFAHPVTGHHVSSRMMM
jgi:hypothetical protein